MLLNLFLVGWLQPWTHYGYERLRFDLRSGALGASLKVGEFNTLSKRFTIRIDRSENGGTQLHGLFVQADNRAAGHRRHRRARPLPRHRRSRHHPAPPGGRPADPAGPALHHAAHPGFRATTCRSSCRGSTASAPAPRTTRRR
jgi:hypothetical protein